VNFDTTSVFTPKSPKGDLMSKNIELLLFDIQSAYL